MTRMRRSWLSLLLIAGLMLTVSAPVFAQDNTPDNPDGGNLLFMPSAGNSAQLSLEDNTSPAVTYLEVPASEMAASARGNMQRTLPKSIDGLKLDQKVTSTDGAKFGPALRDPNAEIDVVVRLKGPSLAEVVSGKQFGAAAVDQTAVVAQIQAQQAQVFSQLQKYDANAKVLANVTKALNAVVVRSKLSALRQLGASTEVASIRPVVNYQLDLSETVPYIGGKAVQDAGFNGAGVRVAVLDSGIDYTHVEFGGAGTAAAYEAAYGTSTTDPRNTTRDGLFPTPKVVEGYDFVGDNWPNGPLAPDDDPIDCGPTAIDCDGGHGTHVADIIAGAKGVAPGASLYAVRVCSAVSTSCSGTAMLQGLDYALDPNGDNNISDHVDIVNMSLGSPYGQENDEDSAYATEIVSKAGVLVVASAGNSADKPFIVGTPSAAPSALSVAQTEVPSSKMPIITITSPASAAGKRIGSTWQPFSAEITQLIEAPVQFGTSTNKLGCDAFPAGTFAGKIALLDRGVCAISIKVSNAREAGALAAIIGLVAPGDPTVFSYGGGDPSIPGLNIRQSDATLLKANIPAGLTVRIDPNDQEPLVQTVVGSSSRGPTMNNHIIKPEIGAPGASVSAIAGTGTDTEPFGGTSGAAPMVSGAAALLKSARPNLSNYELKALLVNTGETDINNKAAILGGYKAPITRIGGGEVRVDRAVAAPIAAWVTNSGAPAISLGFDDWSVQNVVKRVSITVRNYAAQGKTYKICTSYRFADDQANGAVTVTAPNTIYVPGNGTGNFGVKVELKPALLSAWKLNSGALGASADTLTAAEFDGYVTLVEKNADCSSVNGVVHVPWQMLPRKAGEVSLSWLSGPNVKLKNRGVATAPVESYSLIGVSPNMPEGGLGENNPNPDLRYVGYATYPVPAGYCSDDPSFVMAFAVNTFERQTHANAPLSAEFDLDTDQDGNVDYAVYTRDVSTNLSDGRNLVWVYDVASGTEDAWFYTDHQTNSSNTVLTICGEQIGMNANNFFDPMDVTVFAVENYFTGWVTDVIDGITISPLGEQYLGVFTLGGVGFTTLAPKGTGDADKLTIQDYGAGTNNTEKGLLLLYRDGAIPWVEAAAIYVK